MFRVRSVDNFAASMKFAIPLRRPLERYSWAQTVPVGSEHRPKLESANKKWAQSWIC